MSRIVLDIELSEKNLTKELVLFIDGCLQGFSFCPPETFTPNKQSTWNTSHLHGIVWSSGNEYGCPEIQDFVKTDSLWICSGYPFRYKARLHCADRKAKVYGEWAMQHL